MKNVTAHMEIEGVLGGLHMTNGTRGEKRERERREEGWEEVLVSQ